MGTPFANPVYGGFRPDPSVCRVGDDFYLVNSTFQYFPAIALSHSRDLVHWRPIGHAIVDSGDLDLTQLEDSLGVWACDLSHHDGVFTILASLRLRSPDRRIVMLQATRPEGPWSRPVTVFEGGIDPSLFVDDDGTRYLILTPAARAVRLDASGTRTVGPAFPLWEGHVRKASEGPHVFRRGAYYYALLAEGGTGFGHCVTIARASTLAGPYTSCPHNPILVQRNPASPIQRTGHGKMVQTAAGDWFLLYLCGQPLAGGFCTLGRETALAPVTWTSDGWPVVGDGGGPSLRGVVPLAPAPWPAEPQPDHFDGPALSPHWQFVRNPDPARWSLTERPGHLRLRTGPHPLTSIAARNTLVRRETHHRYAAELAIEFAPAVPGHEAGLVCYYDTVAHIRLGLVTDGAGGRALQLTECRIGHTTRLHEARDIPAGPVVLRVKVDGMRRTFAYRAAAASETGWLPAGEVPDARFLSDEAVADYRNSRPDASVDTRNKAFTGTMVGVFATHGDSAHPTLADVDWFRYDAPHSRGESEVLCT
jgi:xylan 1,4-beta-xylosidase